MKTCNFLLASTLFGGVITLAGCFPPPCPLYQITGLTTTATTRTDLQTTVVDRYYLNGEEQTSASNPTVSDIVGLPDGTIIQLRARINTNWDGESYANNDQLKKCTPYFSFSLFPEAHAMAPCRNYHVEEELVNYKITSSGDFDNDHLAGEDLSGLFDLVFTSSTRSQTPSAWTVTSVWGRTEYILEHIGRSVREDSLFILNKAPTLDETHLFTVEFELSNGDILTSTASEPILFDID